MKLHMKYKTKRRMTIAIALAILASLYAFKNFSYFIRASSAVALLLVFYLADHIFDLEFKKKHYVFIFLVAVSSFLLSPLYYIYSNYDKVQHFIQPMFFASIVFHMMKRLKLETKWKLVFTFFVIAAGVGIFEIGEYLLDYFFGLKFQGVYIRDISGVEKLNLLMDRIDDTMVDMVLGMIGSAMYCVCTYFVIRAKTK